jgi:uroporphyrinogen III methyltransferase/synthase
VQTAPGKVYLVGAGPGDPGLITVKGKRCLEEAQVVVYDRLMDPSLLRSAPESAQLVFVGKERGRQAMTQDEINQYLVDRAFEGKTVVRLKGGDPFVFGRGGEEALALAENDIPFEVIPGITSSIAAAAYAGIPITHRGIATTFTVVSGSEDPTKPDSSVPWDVLAKNGGTLVVLMGLAALGSIVETLGRNGMPLDTPAALVNWGTWAKQTTVTGNLENIVDKGKKAGLKPPVVAIFGGVVELREKISWFDRRPLFGKKVLVTRSRTQASRLVGLLKDLGAEPIELPSIQVEPLEDYTALDGALTRLPEFGWVIFASANAVESVFQRLEKQGRDSRAFAGTNIGAIGPATAAALATRGLKADFVPERSISESVVEELSKLEWSGDWNGTGVLLPSADIGRDALAKGLASLGANVERVTAYRTTPSLGMADRAQEAFESGIDAVTFTSSSTVQNLVDMLNGNKSLLQNLPLICIGPTTAATAKDLGLKVDLVAQEHTVEGLVSAVVEHFTAQ